MTLTEKIGPHPLVFGGGALSSYGGGYGFGDVEKEDSLRALRYAFERGVKVFDTAPVYGFGESERRIGQAFKGEREKVFITSKCGVTWDDNKRIRMTNDPVLALKMFEQSLKDLACDFIDLYMVHWPDKEVDIRRPLEVLHRLKIEKKIGHIGLCNTNLEDLEKAQEVDEIDAVQSEHHFFRRQDRKLLDYLKEKDIPFFSWGTLDKGIISGTVTAKREFDRSDCRSRAPWWLQSDKDRKIALMQERVLPFLESKGYTGLEFALGHNVADPGVAYLLCGGKTVAQWEGMFKALDHLPGEDILKECLELREKWF